MPHLVEVGGDGNCRGAAGAPGGPSGGGHRGGWRQQGAQHTLKEEEDVEGQNNEEHADGKVGSIV